MATNIFVNLPVKDLNKTMEFFGKLGYTFNPQFTNEMAAAMVISDNIFAMLVTEPFFKTFIKSDTEICDTTKSTECINCLSTDSRAAVDEMIRKAIDAGGKTWREPQDHGFMYSHGFEDLDGHLWEILWMDPANVNAT